MFAWLKKASSSSYSAADWLHESRLNVEPLTPDLWDLKYREFHKVFLYGRHKRQHPLNSSMEDQAFLATAFTVGKYSVWKKKLGKESYPIAMNGKGWDRPSWAQPDLLPVQGELYAVTTEELIELDKFFQNTLEFTRIRDRIATPYCQLFRIKEPEEGVKGYINQHFAIEDNPQVVTTRRLVHLSTAFIYVGRPEYWVEQMGPRPFNAFDVVQTYTSIGGPGDYYAFTRNEYE